MADGLSIEIVDKQDAVDVSAFVLALTTCLEALEAVEMQIGKESQPQFVWRIENASKNSPLQATIIGDARSLHVPFTPQRVAETLIEGLARLGSDEAIDGQFLLGNQALLAITRFSKLAPKGVKVRFRGFGRTVSVSRDKIIHAKKVMQSRELPSAKCEDIGTIEGLLTVLSGKGKKFQASLEEGLTGQNIPCFFDEGLAPDVQTKWRDRVCVTGAIRRSLHDGSITSIAVHDICKLESSGVDWSNIPALNLTDGVESSEYIRRMRDEE